MPYFAFGVQSDSAKEDCVQKSFQDPHLFTLYLNHCSYWKFPLFILYAIKRTTTDLWSEIKRAVQKKKKKTRRATVLNLFLLLLQSMESFALELFPNHGQVHMALFENVTNASELKHRLINQDTALTCALIDASFVSIILKRI